MYEDIGFLDVQESVKEVGSKFKNQKLRYWTKEATDPYWLCTQLWDHVH